MSRPTISQSLRWTCQGRAGRVNGELKVATSADSGFAPRRALQAGCKSSAEFGQPVAARCHPGAVGADLGLIAMQLQGCKGAVLLRGRALAQLLDERR
eukprot:scaffold17519_cov124-Isochrysis_galbana.AAC.7